jgi:hypothetical protein
MKQNADTITTIRLLDQFLEDYSDWNRISVTLLQRIIRSFDKTNWKDDEIANKIIKLTNQKLDADAALKLIDDQKVIGIDEETGEEIREVGVADGFEGWDG